MEKYNNQMHNDHEKSVTMEIPQREIDVLCARENYHRFLEIIDLEEYLLFVEMEK